MTDVADVPRRWLEAVGADPDSTLGRIESNVEAKLLMPTLWALGWDPLTQLHWGFQISKERFPAGAGESKACDVVAAEQNLLWLTGEAKRWRLPLTLKERQQATDYRKALGAPAGFLSNGVHWVVWGRADEPVFDGDLEPRDVDGLLETLAPLIGPAAIQAVAWPDELAWSVGKSLGTRRRVAGASEAAAAVLSWEPASHGHPCATLVALLRQLSERYPAAVELDVGRSLMVRPRASTGGKKALLEWAPPDGSLVLREADLNSLGVPTDLLARWKSEVQQRLQDEEHARRVADVLEEIVRYIQPSTPP